MSDSFEFTLNSPLTQEDWNKITDAELENTMSITFQTPQGRQVKYIKCDVLDKIRERINLEKLGYPPSAGYYKAIVKVLQIIDTYKPESEVPE